MQRGTKVVVTVIVIASIFAVVTLYAESTLRQAFQRRLLVVIATNVVTSDAPKDGRIPADFGPHCAKAQFAQSGALILQSDVIPANATGVLYVMHEPDGSFGATNGGGDRVKLFFFRTEAPELRVVSAVDNATVLFTMRDRNSTLEIGGTVYGAGQTFRGTFTTPVTIGADAWIVQEAYAVESRGVTTVTVQPPRPCQ